jgi:hypothetical protein
MRCDACHSGAYTSEGTKGAMGTASYAGHVATNGSDCASCHAKAVSGVARQSGWEHSDNQDGHFGGRGERMIVATRR